MAGNEWTLPVSAHEWPVAAEEVPRAIQGRQGQDPLGWFRGLLCGDADAPSLMHGNEDCKDDNLPAAFAATQVSMKEAFSRADQSATSTASCTILRGDTLC
jgi:hypothetical protein